MGCGSLPGHPEMGGPVISGRRPTGAIIDDPALLAAGPPAAAPHGPPAALAVIAVAVAVGHDQFRPATKSTNPSRALFSVAVTQHMVCFCRHAYEMSCRLRDPFLDLGRQRGEGSAMIFVQHEIHQSGEATYRRWTFGASLPQLASIVWLLSRFF